MPVRFMIWREPSRRNRASAGAGGLLAPRTPPRVPHCLGVASARFHREHRLLRHEFHQGL